MMRRRTFNLLTFGIALFVFLVVPIFLALINRYNFLLVHILSFIVSLSVPALIIYWGDRYEKIFAWIAGLMILTDIFIFLGYFNQTLTGFTLILVPFLSIILIVLGIIFRSQFYYAPRAGTFISIVYGISLIRYSMLYGLFAVVIQEGVANYLIILSIIELVVGFLITTGKLFVLDGIYEERFGHIH
ncbi:MAG: hypothetical protein C4537_03335 [Acholeplasma sp.]|jgi:hypothetical protein|nr:MAG: hypothetical protein C4537_03335 [Acholeplasma sp.]